MPVRVRFAVALLALLCACPAHAAGRTVRVGLYPEDRLPARVVVESTLLEARPRSVTKAVFSASGGRAVSTPRLAAPGVESRSPMLIRAAGFPDVRAAGSLRILARGGRVQAVLTQPLEEYAALVTAREIPLNWPPEAIAAQCVAARSFGAASAGRHTAQGYDVCALTHCQLWSPSPPPGAARAAAARTAGMVLTIHGRPAAAPFASTCGGWTAEGAPAGLAAWCHARRDVREGRTLCRESPHSNWSTVLTYREVLSLFELPATKGAVKLTISGRDTGGRVTAISAEASKSKSLKGSDFLLRCGRKLGWARVKSCLFNIKPVNGGFQITGRGLGHGAGMCQWGAKALAEARTGWREILMFYYPDAEVRKL